MFFRIICSELLRRFTEETFLFEIYFHFSSMKTFSFGLFLIGHISVFQLNDPKTMNFFYNFWILRISCEGWWVIYITYLIHVFFLKSLCHAYFTKLSRPRFLVWQLPKPYLKNFLSLTLKIVVPKITSTKCPTLCTIND